MDVFGGVEVWVGVLVFVGVPVLVGVPVGVGVNVEVSVGVGVGVGVKVLVGVAVGGTSATSISSSGVKFKSRRIASTMDNCSPDVPLRNESEP